MRSLCESCEYHQLVKSAELGTVRNHCAAMDIPLQKMGDVTLCKRFSKKDLPHLFYREAWMLDKNKKGDWKFKKPE